MLEHGSGQVVGAQTRWGRAGPMRDPAVRRTGLAILVAAAGITLVGLMSVDLDPVADGVPERRPVEQAAEVGRSLETDFGAMSVDLVSRGRVSGSQLRFVEVAVTFTNLESAPVSISPSQLRVREDLGKWATPAVASAPLLDVEGGLARKLLLRWPLSSPHAELDLVFRGNSRIVVPLGFAHGLPRTSAGYGRLGGDHGGHE